MIRKFVAVVSLSFIVLVLGTGCDSSAAKKTMEKAAETTKDAAKDVAKDVAAGASDLASKATEALAGVEGGSDMLKQATELFGKVTSTLGGVKDADSATSAVAELGKVSEGFAGMTEMFSKMPAAAKSAVADVFKGSIDQLKPIIEKVMAIPGVESILKPAIDMLMSKLDVFKA